MQSRSQVSAAQQETGSSKRIKIPLVQTKRLYVRIRVSWAAPALLIGAGAGGEPGWVTAVALASSTRVS